MKVIITIPAYNEEKTISSVIKEIEVVMGNSKYRPNYQILVINDGSKDKTAEISRKAGALVYSHPQNYGLAETFRTEINTCLKLKADVIVHIDADGQYLAKDIILLLEKIEEGYDLVLGSRFKGKIEYMPFIKKIGNKAFSKVISAITKTKISDAQTGFRAFKRSIAERIDLISDHTYTQEQIIRAVREKFKIAEVPVYFAKRKDKSRLINNSFEYAVKAWINIIRIYRDYEPLKFFGSIGLSLTVAGMLLGLFIVFTFLATGNVGGTPRVILSMLLVLVGIQIILFGFLADMNKR